MSECVLVVEDDQDLAMLIRSLLEKNHFSVHLFEEPLLALDIFKENPSNYVAIVYDMTTKYMSAFEFLRKVRLEQADVKFVLVTTIEIKPSEFTKFLPEIHIDGFIKKQNLSSKLVPIIDELRSPHEITKRNVRKNK